MTKNYPGEQWKTIKFDVDFTNANRIEVSNFGRLRTFNKTSNGDIINGSMINGYRIMRLKLYRPRNIRVQEKLDKLQQQALKLSRKIISMKEMRAKKSEIHQYEVLLQTYKASLSKKFQADLKERTINYHALIHRLVAAYFLKKPTANQTIVGHLDHNKLNNRASNLKWMTPEENSAHQQKSPLVIKDKLERRLHTRARGANIKLTVTKVMLLKKLLNNGAPVKSLVKQFKVSDMQIYRIKWGENWGNIMAAK